MIKILVDFVYDNFNNQSLAPLPPPKVNLSYQQNTLNEINTSNTGRNRYQSFIQPPQQMVQQRKSNSTYLPQLDQNLEGFIN